MNLVPGERILSLPLVALFAVVTATHRGRADENTFGYVYGADTEARGHAEVYQWITSRLGKPGGTYEAWDFNTEVEYGITDRLQASFYLNAARHRIDGVPGLVNQDNLAFRGGQASLKYRLASPDHGGLGVALYLEPGYARVDRVGGDDTHEQELEAKLLLEKHSLGGRVIWAGNVAVEFEREREPEGWSDELGLEFSHGLAVRLGAKWSAGLENSWRAEHAPARLNAAARSAVFLGPSLHYDDERWWFTLTVLPQIYGWPGRGAGHLQLGENERLEIRLKVGVDL